MFQLFQRPTCPLLRDSSVIKYRFTPDQIEFLQQFKWWNMPEDWIRENWQMFEDIEKFAEKFT